MSHYPYLSGKDKLIARKIQVELRSLAAQAKNPRLRSSALSWAAIIRECLKTPWPGAAK